MHESENLYFCKKVFWAKQNLDLKSWCQVHSCTEVVTVDLSDKAFVIEYFDCSLLNDCKSGCIKISGRLITLKIAKLEFAILVTGVTEKTKPNLWVEGRVCGSLWWADARPRTKNQDQGRVGFDLAYGLGLGLGKNIIQVCKIKTSLAGH